MTQKVLGARRGFREGAARTRAGRNQFLETLRDITASAKKEADKVQQQPPRPKATVVGGQKRGAWRAEMHGGRTLENFCGDNFPDFPYPK